MMRHLQERKRTGTRLRDSAISSALMMTWSSRTRTRAWAKIEVGGFAVSGEGDVLQTCAVRHVAEHVAGLLFQLPGSAVGKTVFKEPVGLFDFFLSVGVAKSTKNAEGLTA